MLDKIKTIIGISLSDTTKDTILNYLIDDCIEYAEQVTHTDIDNIPEGLVVQMVIYRYNLLGSEGLNSESYSGVSFNYSQDYPAHIINGLKSCRKVIFK